MKNIVIAPRFKFGEKVQSAVFFTDLSDYFLEKGFLPLGAFLQTSLLQQKQIQEVAKKYIKLANGLVFLGGQDIDKKFYNPKTSLEVKLKNTTPTKENLRDLFEFTLLKLALEKNIPIFGICRGLQMINVGLGGSLLSDLEDTKTDHVKFKPGRPKITLVENVKLDLEHLILLKPNSLLSQKLKKTEITVNSIHHQGIANLAKGLKVEAVTEDGVIEAISGKNNKILATQWHPELDLKNPINQQILDIFLEMM